MVGFTVVGALIAGLYGSLHDQITYSIGPEYFTNFKFVQFEWAQLKLGNRLFVGCIGFLATWWVGMIVAWVLARRLIPFQPRTVAYRKIWLSFATVFGFAFVFGVVGYAYGLCRGPNADYSEWQHLLDLHDISDKWAFMRVAYIHNFGYLGVVAGAVAACVLIRPEKRGKE